MSEDRVNDRKLEHIQIIQSDEEVDRQKYYFDQVHLMHRALPEIDLDDIDPSIEFLGKRLTFPLIISSMTGGDHAVVNTINRNLAAAAEETGVAMGVGSQRVMFSSPEAKQSFNLRDVAPTTLLFSNLGGVQINKGFGLAECQEAIQILQADALYFHLNPLQEAIQPEGDTQFRGLAQRLGEIAAQLEQPVIIKEVGSGVAPADVDQLLAHGINIIDVAGAGGTSWSRIEHHRHQLANDPTGLVFQDWGLPTPVALELLAPYRDRVTLIASGGIRSGVDMVKALVLGARLCGLASPFLAPAMKSKDAVVDVIQRLRKEFVTAMFLLGCQSAADLIGASHYRRTL